MELNKKKLLEVLDAIVVHQKEISECQDYYQRLEKELDHKREHMVNPEDLSDLIRVIGALNREFEEKSEHMFERLNQFLIKGYDLSKVIGKEIAHDFKLLWDYMTDPVRKEVKLNKVLKEIERIKKDFSL